MDNGEKEKMSRVLEEIMKCEEAYIRCFCKVREEEKKAYYTDDLLPDMYEHNFTLLKEKLSQRQLQDFIMNETQKAIEAKVNFYKVKVPTLPKEMVTNSQGKLPQVETLGIYLCDLEKITSWRNDTQCNVKKIVSDIQIEELVALDLIHDRDTCGEDFCKRRARRRGKVYKSDIPCDSYIGYYQGKPVANCDLFIDGNCAKIEDFAVIPEYQRRGIGTTLLKALIYKAQKKGAKIVYLNADEEDTPKEMYVKLGFKKLGELYSLFWNL